MGVTILSIMSFLGVDYVVASTTFNLLMQYSGALSLYLTGMVITAIASVYRKAHPKRDSLRFSLALPFWPALLTYATAVYCIREFKAAPARASHDAPTGLEPASL